MSRDLFFGYEAGKSMGEWLRGGRIDFDGDSLVQHAFVCGATGYGKTVFAKGLVEQAVLSGVPVIAVDFKGDLASLALTGNLAALPVLQDVFLDDADTVHREYRTGIESQRAVATELPTYSSTVEPRIFTPNSSIGTRTALLALPSFPDPPADDIEAEEQDQLTETLVRAFCLSMFGSEGQLKRNESSVKFLEEIVRHCNRRGLPLEATEGISRVLAFVDDPPFGTVGGLPVDEYIGGKERTDLKRRLASRLAGAERSKFSGDPLNVETLIGSAAPGRTPLSIIYLGHISDFHEQSLVLAQVCADIYRWMRRRGGSAGLRLLLYVDEVGGGDGAHAFYPSAPYNPPSKGPLSFLIKQGRSAGVGVLLATQNPVSVDVRGLGNVDTWAIGRLTRKNDLDRIKHVLENLPQGEKQARQDVSGLPAGRFLTRSGGLAKPQWVEERWLFSVHRQLSTHQVKALHEHLARDGGVGSVETEAAGDSSDEVIPPPAVESMPAVTASAQPVQDEPEKRIVRQAIPREAEVDREAETVDLAEDPTSATVDLEASGPTRWVLHGAGDPSPIAEGFRVTVGRSSRATILLDDDTVSREHLEFVADGSRITVGPKSAKNPTRLDGDPLDTAMVLNASEAPFVLELGRTRLALRWE